MKRKHETAKQAEGKEVQAPFDKEQVCSAANAEEFFAMPDQDQEFWNNVGQAVTEVRAGASLRQASHKFDLDPRMYRGSAVRNAKTEERALGRQAQ